MGLRGGAGRGQGRKPVKEGEGEQVNDRDAERLTWLIDWMVAHGLLHYYDRCTRPDRTHGPAWVLRKPYMVAGDSCLGWGATAEAALDAARSANAGGSFVDDTRNDAEQIGREPA